MRALRAGEDGVLLDVGDLDRALALAVSIRRAPPDGVTEVVPAARTVLLRYDRSATTAERLATDVAARRLDPATAASATVPDGEVVDIPVIYDGADLAEVAERCGLSTEEVVARHTAARYTVAFTGFAPGFGYLAGGDPALRVPRRESPRTAIPAGSVALAGEFSGVYPRASPGGWHLLGRTNAVLFDVGREPPALLRPGGRVRFVAVDELPGNDRPGDASRTSAGAARDGDGGAPDGLAGPGLEVIDPGGQALLQDLGREGVAGLGLSPSGAVDRGALRRANRRAGNPPWSVAVEVALGGLRLRARGDLVIAVAGAPAPLRVAGRPVAGDRAVAVDDGEEVGLGAPPAGVYTYLAVRGGIDSALVLGSAARDVLAELGPEPLRAGDRLAIGRGATDAVRAAEPEPPLPGPGETVTVQVLAGPRTDWFTPEALGALTGQDWTVGPASNRIGLRLSGDRPLARARTDELASEPTGRGAIQVPPDGQPVLFAADHPVTGGYPVIGYVTAHDLDRAAQAPPGAALRLRVTGPPAQISEELG